ncbi:endoglucanase A precursor [Thraustotheca clavata]|uniref:Endoglucanase A n=1 Tax=Thraustotheca clavata TaxID=74557 RepID=A0A1V9YX09_9STRA|nr:endoglucanase A precursor [Thraustotheca clavata]
MKGFFTIFLSALAASSVLADFCDDWGQTRAGNYIVYNNLWGKRDATSGSQCTGVDKVSGSNVAWHTSYSWAGGKGKVKTYANANLVFNPKQLNKISSIPSTWKWSYTNQGNHVANVAYDLFTSPTTSTKENSYEIMIWLSAIGGALPISSTGSPISSIAVNGVQFKLYRGINKTPDRDVVVFSFVAANPISNFNGDLKTFLNHLTQKQGLPVNQYLTTLQAGTEPFSGNNCRFTVSSYTASVN